MAGKDKGQQGKVAAVTRKKQEVVVHGLNCVRINYLFVLLKFISRAAGDRDKK